MKIKNVKTASREEIKALQAVELNILNQLKDVLEKHGLRFFLLGGTMIGAVRNGGFVPWDDDVDVIMFRDDYELFFNNQEEWLKDTDLVLVRSNAEVSQHTTGMNLKDKTTTFINKHSVR